MNSMPEDTDDLRDAHLRRALAHAPDHNVAPDWRLRKAILRRAHDAIGATDPDTDAAELERAARPWWRRAGERGGKDARRMRRFWSAAVATVLLAVLVGVLWQREPVPGPGLNAEAPAKPPSPPVPAPSAGPAQGGTGSVASLAESVTAPPPPPAPVAPALPELPPAAGSAALLAPTDLPPVRPRKESEATAQAPIGIDRAPTTPVAPRVAPAAPAAPVAPAAAPDAARKAPPAVRTDETDPPTFVALSTWNRITISRRGGESRSLPRAEARELNALLGSAALSAVGPRPLAGAPEWRVTLERSGEVLAVFEIAGAQVRWREGRTPAATGVPSAPALAALREALQRAVRPPDAAPAGISERPAEARASPRNP
ncbi:hypothetical protein AB4Z46_11680 [Variovorax sp. M-6]|uniref:hypothetical protein n=1 Tax=Variovorax sp. M-6 TaxID=3233041 RepID=UPI003F997AF5